jgi:hypothetical protein
MRERSNTEEIVMNTKTLSSGFALPAATLVTVLIATALAPTTASANGLGGLHSTFRESGDGLSSNFMNNSGNGVGAFRNEQTLTIRSQSSGAGAGKITFNPFSATR